MEGGVDDDQAEEAVDQPYLRPHEIERHHKDEGRHGGADQQVEADGVGAGKAKAGEGKGGEAADHDDGGDGAAGEDHGVDHRRREIALDPGLGIVAEEPVEWAGQRDWRGSRWSS